MTERGEPSIWPKASGVYEGDLYLRINAVGRDIPEEKKAPGKDIVTEAPRKGRCMNIKKVPTVRASWTPQ